MISVILFLINSYVIEFLIVFESKIMKDIIKHKIDLIAQCIYSKVQNGGIKSFGLYTGEFGVLLFLFYYSNYTKSKKYALLTEKYAKKLLEQLMEREVGYTFCSGFSGELYLFEYLRENYIIDFDINDTQTILDGYLIHRMRQNIQCKYFDFMHGALGIGLYLLKRPSRTGSIWELINFLYNTAEKNVANNVFKWKSIINPDNGLVGYNLSMSHGVSSIIIFLSRVIKSGISNKKIQEMLSGAVNFVLSQQRDLFQYGSYFPNYVLINPTETTSKSRLAWCYGDLGIGIALWQAGKVMEESKWEEKGFEILFQSTHRRDLKENHVKDAGICHGSVGIAMIYRRLFLETHCVEFRDATQYWLNQTLNLSYFNEGLAGYKTFEHNDWICNYSLLTGISGIGLAFISYLNEDQQKWDEMFLLS